MTEDLLPAKLSHADLEILKLLWMDLFFGKGFGLKRHEILRSLQENLQGDCPIKTDAALRAHLKNLRKHDPSWIVAASAQTNASGGKPLVYKFDRDATISWPSTAFMLLRLWEFRGRAVERRVFIDQMMSLHIQNSSTQMIATEDELGRQIETSIAWKYIDYVNTSVLLPMPRIHVEYELLTFIAKHLEMNT